jgi:transposase
MPKKKREWRRLKYDPELCDRHRTDYTTAELAYICSVYAGKKKRDIALALGRTESAILMQVKRLKLDGSFDRYKEMGEKT